MKESRLHAWSRWENSYIFLAWCQAFCLSKLCLPVSSDSIPPSPAPLTPSPSPSPAPQNPFFQHKVTFVVNNDSVFCLWFDKLCFAPICLCGWLNDKYPVFSRLRKVLESAWKSLKFESPFSSPWSHWKSVKIRHSTWKSLKIKIVVPYTPTGSFQIVLPLSDPALSDTKILDWKVWLSDLRMLSPSSSSYTYITPAVFCSCPFLFILFFSPLVLINRRNGPRHQRVLASCTFFFFF